MCGLVAQLCPTLCNPVDCSPPGSPVHGDSPDENTGVGCHALLQGISLTQRGNLCLLCLQHWQVGSLTTSATWEASKVGINDSKLQVSTQMLHPSAAAALPSDMWDRRDITFRNNFHTPSFVPNILVVIKSWLAYSEVCHSFSLCFCFNEENSHFYPQLCLSHASQLFSTCSSFQSVIHEHENMLQSVLYAVALKWFKPVTIS